MNVVHAKASKIPINKQKDAMGFSKTNRRFSCPIGLKTKVETFKLDSRATASWNKRSSLRR